MRSIRLKNFLINTVFAAASAINKLVPKNDRKVMIYCNMGFRDNNRYLYNFMIENSYNEHYFIYVSASDYQKHQDYAPKNVKFISLVSGIFHFFTTRVIYYSFGRIPIIPAKNQCTVQMWHGTSFKGFDETMRRTNSQSKQFYTQVYASSEYFRSIVSKKFSCPEDRVVICGHPRTDTLFCDEPFYRLGEYKKLVVWLPTFRKSEKLQYADVEEAAPIPVIPVMHLKKFDEHLASLGVKVIVKLHPLQDISQIDTSDFTNFFFMSNEEFLEKNYDLYLLLRQADALITDYSSVFYDYLLLNRPIGFTEDDMEEYTNKRGFAVDDPDAFRPGMKIRSEDDLYTFINDLASGRDEYAEQRTKINHLVNANPGNGNCRRALELAGL